MITKEEKKRRALHKKQYLRDTARRERALQRAFKPYGVALARVVFHWNKLHESLSLLFTVIVKPPPKTSVHPVTDPERALPLAIWHSTESDSTQRKMLREAAINAQNLTGKQRKDIIEVLNTIDRQLRGYRNKATHAPLNFAEKVVAAGSELYLHANPGSANKYAQELKDADLIEEFEKYAALAEGLNSYVE